jgi:hypothetical protein
MSGVSQSTIEPTVRVMAIGYSRIGADYEPSASRAENLSDATAGWV